MVALIFTVGTVPAAAVTYPAFTFDAPASSISVIETGSLCFGCDLTAAFSAGVDGATWVPTSPTDSWGISNFIDWTATGGFGGAVYDVVATLAFSTPDAASTTGSGSAGYASLFGVISAGFLTWNSFAPISFGEGSQLAVFMEGGLQLVSGVTTTSGVTFVGDTISPVPLPAGLVLLLGGLGGLAFMRRPHTAA